MSIIDAHINNSSCITTKTTKKDMNGIEENHCHQLDHYESSKTESFLYDVSIMDCLRNDEMEQNIVNSFESEREGRENNYEIYDDSTNELEDGECRETKRNRIQAQALSAKNCEKEVEEVCGLSKLYLNDNETVSTSEDNTEPIAMEVENNEVGIKQQQQLMQQNKALPLALGVIFRFIFPLTNGVVRGLKGIKDVRFLKVVRSIASSRVALTNLFAYAANTISLNLSSVQVTHRLEPVLKLLKIRLSRDGIESLPDSQSKLYDADSLTSPLAPPTYSPFSREPRYSLPNFQYNYKKVPIEEHVEEHFCTLNILAEPPSGQPIRADIVFIHGLNGSLANTWKQGLWENERRPVEFQRPPKPPVRPPKRPRHSRTNAVHPVHHKKRARFSYTDVCERYSHERDPFDEVEETNSSFMCNEIKDLEAFDGIECSFPTFRVRVHDNGRLLQPEHDAKQSDAKNKQNSSESPEDTKSSSANNDFNKKPMKPSPNDPNYSKCWPGDWLPIDCPGVRVIALNYTTDQHLWRPVWKKKEARTNLVQRSREMIELLIRHRVGYGHPIIWVGHSKGGLFIKQIIVDAWESGRPAATPFWRSARGVFFYSVPHRGSHLASIKAPFLSRSVELIDVEKNNKYLLDLHRRFVGLYHLGHLKIEVFSFVETALTLMSVLYMRIVGVDSADPGIGDVCGIRLDHREICKPRSRDCILYKQLVNMINKVS